MFKRFICKVIIIRIEIEININNFKASWLNKHKMFQIEYPSINIIIIINIEHKNNKISIIGCITIKQLIKNKEWRIKKIN